MKNIGFSSSGWRSFLGRSLVGGIALLAFTSVYAVVIDDFNDSFEPVLITKGQTKCNVTEDSGNNMVGNFREVKVTAEGGSVTMEVDNGMLSIGAGVDASASLQVIWDNTANDCTLTKDGPSIASFFETWLGLAIKADHPDSTVVITIYTTSEQYSVYEFDVGNDGDWQILKKELDAPDRIGSDGKATLSHVTAVTLIVKNFAKQLDVAFNLLETPVEVADFECFCSDGMMNYKWKTTLEENIGSFLVGSCSDTGCRLLGEVVPQGVGFSYKTSLAAAADGNCAMAVLGVNGELETVNGQVVVHTGSCD